MTPPPGGFAATGFAAAPQAKEANTLVDLLTRQRDHYQQLKALSDQQQALVEAGQPERLLAVLGERQSHVEALTTLNEQLAPLRPRMSEVAESAPVDVRNTLRRLVDDVQELLETIIAQDEQDKQRLTQGREAVRQELGKISRTPAALSAYKHAAPQTRQPRFTDARG
ncbi:MAG: flagellar export chaperone FlgN [Planctomycetota bacterium]